jgi:hypothetical protein
MLGEEVMNQEKKFDFEHIDVKLYLALRKVTAEYQVVVNGPEFSGSGDWVMIKQCEDALEEFELSHGPLPDWAVARNWAYELVPGAQLMTKDGRVTGNAHILRCHPKESGLELRPLYDCITDAGSYIHGFSEAEIHNQFWIGDYVSDPQTLIARFGNHGEDYGVRQNDSVQ